MVVGWHFTSSFLKLKPLSCLWNQEIWNDRKRRMHNELSFVYNKHMYVCTWMGCTHALMLLSSWHGYEFLSIGLKYRTFSCSQEKKLTLLKKSKHRCVGKSEKGKCCLIMHTVIISWLHGFFHLHGNHLSWESLIISGITTMYLQQNTACTSPLNSIKYLYYCPC